MLANESLHVPLQDSFEQQLGAPPMRLSLESMSSEGSTSRGSSLSSGQKLQLPEEEPDGPQIEEWSHLW